jgi:hypothetical protein
MAISLAYWILMLIWFVFGILGVLGHAGTWGFAVNYVLLFVLFLFLGWKVFGPPLRGQ